jgi:RecA-family ATPase
LPERRATMMTGKEWTLVQRYPSYKRIPQESPLCNNTIFAYSTKGRELAPTFEGLFQDYFVTNPQNDYSEISSGVGKFESIPDSTLDISCFYEDQDQPTYVDKDLTNETNNVQTKDLDQDEGPFDLSGELHTLDELLILAEEEYTDLIENLIPYQDISFLAGDSDVGKSLFCTELCLAIIEGKTEFLNRKLNSKYRRAIILNSEDSARSVGRRIKKMLSGRHLQSEIMKNLWVLSTSKECLKKLEYLLKKKGVDLIVVDAFSDVFEGDLNSSSSTRNFLNQYLELIRKYECTVLFIHHIGKGKENITKDSMLGSVGIHGKARGVLILSRQNTNSDLRVLKIVKGNDMSDKIKAKPVYLTFNSDTLTHECVAEISSIGEYETQQEKKERKRKLTPPMLEKAWKLKHEEGKTLRAIGSLIGISPSQLSRSLNNYQPNYTTARETEATQ